MSSTDGQPPLTRRQVRDLERAREAGQTVTGAVPVPASASVPMPTPASAPAPVSPPASAPAPSSASTSAADAPAPASAPVPDSAPVPVSAPASAPAPSSAASPERGLTRRELRALREAQSGRSSEPVPLQPPGPEPRRPLSEAFSAVDEIIAPTGQIPRVETASSPTEGAGSEATSASSAPTPALRPASFERREPTAPAAASAAPVRPVVPTIPASAPESNGFVPPVGHWTTQSSEPDGDTAPGRALGTHTGQTNALILTDQQVADVTGALNATGEIIITGSIDLPRSLGATGSQARVDNADIDRLLEQGDAENAETDAVPVRASRAISTHTSTRAVVLAASQPKASRLPLYLGIGGGIIGAGIIGVVVAGFASGILGQ
jgi:hypothetical protein